MATQAELPHLRWGVVATGMIASWFVSDLVLFREDAQATHHIQAVGSSSISKARDFVKEFIPASITAPSCYGSYEEVYNDPNVDIIYIATPHAFHAKNCLDAIAAGKHVLCEKPFAMNAKETKQVIAAAREKGVFVMEALWTRFFPLTAKLQSLLHYEKIIGNIQRVFCDFGLDMPIEDLPATSRLKDRSLGAGSLLDIGIYSLTWGLLALEKPGQQSKPTVVSMQTLSDGIDTSSSILLFYPENGRQGILTSTTCYKTEERFMRVEGSKGTLYISGPGASMPDTITVILKAGGGKDMGDKNNDKPQAIGETKSFNFGVPKGARGFFYEADSVALDINNGRTESEIMPLSETLRVLEILDSVRKAGGASFPQDLE